MTSSITLGDVAREAAQAALAQAFVCRPARVEKYDAATNTCTALVLLPVLLDTPTGRRSQDFQPLEHVPVLPVRAGNVSFTVKPEPGDLVLLLFADRSLELLLETGQAGEPGDPRHHDVMDAVALPVFFTQAGVPPDAGTNSIGWESAPGNPGLRIHFTASALCLGEAAPTYHVALAEKVQDSLEALQAVLQEWTPVPNDGGLSLKTALVTAGIIAPIPPLPGVPAPWPGSLGSSSVKVKE